MNNFSNTFELFVKIKEEKSVRNRHEDFITRKLNQCIRIAITAIISNCRYTKNIQIMMQRTAAYEVPSLSANTVLDNHAYRCTLRTVFRSSVAVFLSPAYPKTDV